MNWTKPYYGIQHLGNLGEHRVSVTDYGRHAVLTLWARGCGFNPTDKWFKNVEDAREAGEKWLAKMKSGEMFEQPSQELKKAKAEIGELNQHIEILTTALSEIKATNDGASEQPIKVILDWCIEEVAKLKKS